MKLAKPTGGRQTQGPMPPSSLDSQSPRRLALSALLLMWAVCPGLLVWSPAPLLSVWFWWSLTAAPVGALASRGPRWVALSLGSSCWLLAITSAWFSGVPFPRPMALAAACSALYLVGHCLGRLWPVRQAWAVAGLLWIGAGLLTALPAGAGLLHQPWSPRVTAQLLDLSPQVWAFEAGGFDWLRHPAVYERAGTADLSPDLRVAWGAGSAYLGLAIAALLAFVVERFTRACD